MHGQIFSAERMAEEFMRVLIEGEYRPHVWRVGPWLGLLIRGVEKIKVHWWIPRSRQLHFDLADGRRFKAKFSHKNGGQIVFVQIGREPGAPEITTVFAAKSMADAERFYLLPTLVTPNHRAAA